MARYDFKTTRLFVPDNLASGADLAIIGDRANYLLNVLRLRDGAAVLVFNGRDGEWQGTLTGTTKRAATLRIAERTRSQVAGPDIDYLFAPLKHARLDYLVQKAVEMGARRLRPVVTRRTQVTRINGERMRANVVEAAEQCGVLAVPDVAAEQPLPAVLADWDATRTLILCDEDAPTFDPIAALRAAAAKGRHALLIGPEGGFDESERSLLLAHPATVRISLGPRILRADTAGVAAMALVQSILGDWSARKPPDTFSPS